MRFTMGIFDGIEKLINEHGSAKILGERLLLAKDQNAAQEKRISELQTQLEKSEAEKAVLRLQLQRSQAENQQSAQLIQKLQNSPPLLKRSPFMYAEGDEDPYCTYCWQAYQKRIQYPPPFQSAAGPVYKCQNCNNSIIHPRIEQGFGDMKA